MFKQTDRMRILMSTTYYYPHVSGLTLHAQWLAEELVQRGHQVSVLTSQHQENLPRQETLAGVKIIRVPATAKFSKAILMPSFWLKAIPLVRQADLVHLHLPSLEGADLALLAKVFRRRLVVTYHCDIVLPKAPVGFAWFKPFLQLAVDFHNFIACFLSDTIVTNTQDFARSSRLLRFFPNKIQPNYPPVQPLPKSAPLPQLARKYRFPTLGVVCRIAQDKGVEYVLGALSLVAREFPQVRLALSTNQSAVGEEVYWRKLQLLFRKYHSRLILPDSPNLSRAGLSSFYNQIDLLVVASVNSTESFGVVQVEAMLCGTPVVATNLPGVRVPTQVTGMGEIAKIADSQDLADKIIKVLKNKERYLKPKAAIQAIFSLDKTVENYERVYYEQVR